MFDNPVIADFKTTFSRDFPFGTTTDYVMDQDISNALTAAFYNINQCLFINQGQYSYAFLLLAAHFLTLSLRSSSQGIGGAYNFPATSRAVGSVSVGTQIPEFIESNPAFLSYYQTNYGAAYLQFILPYLVGVCFTLEGATQA